MDAVFTCEVTAIDMDGLVSQAWERACAVFGVEALKDWRYFQTFDIVEFAGGYSARVTVRVPVSGNQPAVWFGKL